jgi:uncharacterized protein YfcZ (UPF0381/DUF406 family)
LFVTVFAEISTPAEGLKHMMGKPPQLPSSGMLTSDGRRGLFGVGVAILGFAVFIPDVARSSDTGEDAEELLRLSLSCPLEPLKSASANTNPSYKATKTPTYKSVGDKRNLKIIMTREDRTYFDTINKVSVVKVIEAQDALYQNFSPRIKIRPRSDFPGSVWEVTAFCSVSLKGGEAEGCMSYSMGTVPDKADARYSYKGDKLRFLVCDEENANNAKAALEELITAAKDAETAAPAAVKQSTPDASGLKATIESTNKKSSKNPNSDGLSKTLTIKTE